MKTKTTKVRIRFWKRLPVEWNSALNVKLLSGRSVRATTTERLSLTELSDMDSVDLTIPLNDNFELLLALRPRPEDSCCYMIPTSNWIRANQRKSCK